MRGNEKHKDAINEHGYYDDQVYKLKSEYRDDKAMIRQMNYDTIDKRRQLVSQHDKVVQLESTCRRMKELIEVSKRDSQKTHNNTLEGARPDSIVEGKKWDVDEMKKKVQSAKKMLKTQRTDIDHKVKKQEEDITDMEHQVKILDLKVKEKSKELNLAELKIKEIKRNLRYQTLKPLPRKGQVLTSRMQNGGIRNSVNGGIVKHHRGKNSDVYRYDSNTGDGRNITNSEIRLDQSESSLLSQDKQIINQTHAQNGAKGKSKHAKY